MKKILTLVAFSLAFLTFSPDMNAQEKKVNNDEIRTETRKQVEMLTRSLDLDVDDQKRMERSLYAYNLNTEIHVNNASKKDDAYFLNKEKFENSLRSTTKKFLDDGQYQKFLKEVKLSPSEKIKK